MVYPFIRNLCLASLFLVSIIPALEAKQGLRSANGQDVRAMLVGIDQYERVGRLRGAVADTRDIEASLLRAGVPKEKMTVLIDAQVSRQAFRAGIEKLIEEANPGETIILAFAGHGMQRPERIKGSEPDGMNEFFVLTRYGKEGANNAELIEDKEINFWLRKLDKKGVDVLFLSDTCHGGGLARSWAAGAGEVTYRKLDDATIIGEDFFRGAYDEPEPSGAKLSLKELQITISDMPRVSFMAAVDKNTKAPEIHIPGQPTPRGALSYSFARAIDNLGKAGLGKELSRQELYGYSRQQVLQLVAGRQNIQTEPIEADDLQKVIFKLDEISSNPEDTSPPAVNPAEALEKIRIAVINGDGGVLAMFLNPNSSFIQVGQVDEADLVWDQEQKVIVSRQSGDIIARDVRPEEIEGISDRTRVVNRLNRLSETNPQTFALKDDSGKLYTPRDTPTLVAQNLAGRHFLVFGIAYNGQVQMVFPPKGSSTRPMGESWMDSPRVVPPFGVDHAIAMSSPSDLSALARWIWQRNGRMVAGELYRMIEKTVKETPDTRIGTLGLYTSP